MRVCEPRPCEVRAHRIFSSSIFVAVLTLAGPVQAQDTEPEGFGDRAESEEADELEAIEDQLMESVGEGEEIEEPESRAQELPEIGEDKLEVFILDRGFYLASDLGIFLTLGGTRGYSNVQPYLSVKAGIDIGDYFGIQLNLSTGYSSGNPKSGADRPLGSGDGFNPDATVNYGMFNVGVEVVGAIRPTERVAIEPKAGGGYTLIDPPLSFGQDRASVGKHDGSGGHFVGSFS